MIWSSDNRIYISNYLLQLFSSFFNSFLKHFSSLILFIVPKRLSSGDRRCISLDSSWTTFSVSVWYRLRRITRWQIIGHWQGFKVWFHEILPTSDQFHIFRTIKHLLIRNLLYISEWRAHKTASSSAAALYGCKKYFINWSLSFQSRSIPVALPFPRETRAPPSRSLSLLSPSDHTFKTPFVNSKLLSSRSINLFG